jgi:hypothetical protein
MGTKIGRFVLARVRWGRSSRWQRLRSPGTWRRWWACRGGGHAGAGTPRRACRVGHGYAGGAGHAGYGYGGRVGGGGYAGHAGGYAGHGGGYGAMWAVTAAATTMAIRRAAIGAAAIGTAAIGRAPITASASRGSCRFCRLAYATYWYDGIPYYYANDVYYTWNPTYDGYTATDPPPAMPILGRRRDPRRATGRVRAKGRAPVRGPIRARRRCNRVGRSSCTRRTVRAPSSSRPISANASSGRAAKRIHRSR